MNIGSKKIVLLILTFFWISSAVAGEWIIGLDGLGPLKIGMTTAQVINAKGNLKFSLDDDELDSQSGGCVGVYNSDIYLQFTQSRLEEINVTSPKFKTADGIGLGSTFADIKRVYGKNNLIIGSNHYIDDVPEVTIEASDKIKKLHPKMNVGIKFEFKRGPLVSASKITGISIGAHYVEGCS